MRRDWAGAERFVAAAAATALVTGALLVVMWLSFMWFLPDPKSTPVGLLAFFTAPAVLSIAAGAFIASRLRTAWIVILPGLFFGYAVFSYVLVLFLLEPQT